MAAVVDGNARDGAEEVLGDEVGDVDEIEQAVIESQAALAHVEARLGEDLLVDEEDGGSPGPHERSLDRAEISAVTDCTVIALKDVLRGGNVDAVFVDDVLELSGKIEEAEDRPDLALLVPSKTATLEVEVRENIAARSSLEGALFKSVIDQSTLVELESYHCVPGIETIGSKSYYC